MDEDDVCAGACLLRVDRPDSRAGRNGAGHRAQRVEVGIVLEPFPCAVIRGNCPPEVPRGDVELARECLEAGELVVQLAVVGVSGQAGSCDLRGSGGSVRGERRVPVLVRRGRHRTGRAADHEHARAVDEGAGAAPRLGLDEEELLRAELELFAVDLEERAAGEDDV